MDIGLQILKIFEKNPDKQFSASQIVNKIKPDLFDKLNDLNKITQKNEIREVKREILKLQRIVLYHLNNLFSRGVIIHSTTSFRGSKFFKINLDSGKELYLKQKEVDIKISKPLGIPIEGYEKKNIIEKFEQETWLNRLNSILVNCSNLNDKQIITIVNRVSQNINDVIGLYNIENIHLKKDFFKKIELLCEDYDKKLNYIINVDGDIIKVVNEYLSIKPKNTLFIFEINRKDLENENLMEIFSLFSKQAYPVYLKNNDVHDPPYLIGKAGPYTFNKNEWEAYKKNFEAKTLCLVCSKTTILVDVKKYFEYHKNFNNLIKRVINTIFKVNVHQRKNFNEYFNELMELNKPYYRELFILGQNYIRLWNYGWKDPKLNQDDILNDLRNTSEDIKKISKVQETIYRSCGMPIKFNIALSCAFQKQNLSEPTFNNITLANDNDIYLSETIQSLKQKEKLFKIFNGGDILKLVKYKEPSLRELGLVLSYNIPLICYEFRTNPNYDLTRFFE